MSFRGERKDAKVFGDGGIAEGEDKEKSGEKSIRI